MMENRRRVVVTGSGCISPIGNSTPQMWEAARAGRLGIDYIQGFDGTGIQIKVAAQVKGFDVAASGMTPQEIRHYDKFTQFAVAASLEAMKSSGLVCGENIDPARLGVYVGSAIGGLDTFMKQAQNAIEAGPGRVSPLFIPMMIANIGGADVAIKVGAQGPCLCTVSACASGTNSIGEAYLAIRDGRADAILAGGSDAAINIISIGGFTNCRALSLADDPQRASIPFDAERKGFVMGEGAAVLMLEEYGHARARGASILAEVCGYGHTCDAYHYTSPKPDGVATARAISDALEQAGYKSGEALYINAHGTGTPLNDSSETKAIKLALGPDAYAASVSSTKSMTGHMLGAAGAIELLICALALKEGVVPPTIGLQQPDPECDLDYTAGQAVHRNLDIAISNSLGFGGHNAVVALRKYHE